MTDKIPPDEKRAICEVPYLSGHMTVGKEYSVNEYANNFYEFIGDRGACCIAEKRFFSEPKTAMSYQELDKVLEGTGWVNTASPDYKPPTPTQEQTAEEVLAKADHLRLHNAAIAMLDFWGNEGIEPPPELWKELKDAVYAPLGRIADSSRPN